MPHARARHVRWRPALIFAAAGLVGALIGSSIGKAMDGHKLLILFALLMLFIAAMMLRVRKAEVQVVPTGQREDKRRLSAIGLGVGMLAGFYGIGGGFLVAPALILGTGMPTIAAVGSALVSVGTFGMTTAVFPLRSRGLAGRPAVHPGRDRRRMDRRAPGESTRRRNAMP